MYAHAQAPARIGIAGGGTDLLAWTSSRRGFCLSLAINTHAHAVVITRPDRQVVAVYRERHSANAATEIANGLIRESALMHGWEDGFEVHTISEVSSYGSGLGVSSSFAVCLAAAFSRMSRLRKGDLSEDETSLQSIARGAWEVEIDRLRRPIGRQDHMAAVHGGLRLYAFEKDRATVERSFSDEDATWVANHLVLVKLPEGHDSRAILSNVKNAGQLQSAFEAVPIAVRAIEERSVALLGAVLLAGQSSKRSIPGAVPPSIEALTDVIQDVPEVYGCKIAGAGGGGHLVVACGTSAIDALREKTRLAVLQVHPDHRGVRSEGWL